MPLRLGNERVQAIAAFQSRHRAEMLTVVFTDLVGLTRLRQERGDADALSIKEEHGALMREVLREHPESLEIAAQGDRFFLAFSRPSEAVGFALRLQARLRQWNRGRAHPLGVRMGVHVGEVILETSKDSGSIHGLNGLEVDRCERVMDLAEPGHILLTRPAFEMARTALKGVRLESGQEVRWFQHGPYALKGLAEPVEICEVADRETGECPPPPDADKARRVPLPVGPMPTITRGQAWRGALVTVLLSAALLAWEEGPLAALSYDLSYLLRHGSTSHHDAIIVAIDEESFRRANGVRSVPWDRGQHAELIDLLGQCPARAIVMDFFFPDAPTNQADLPAIQAQLEANRRLSEAARTNGRVVVAAKLRRHSNGIGLVDPFEPLRDYVRSGGVSVPTSDETVNKETRKMFFETEVMPSLPRELARLLDRDVPPVGQAPQWLNYYGPPGTFEKVPYWQTLEGLRSGELQNRFRGQLVFVGVDDRGIDEALKPDLWITPYFFDRRAPGVEVVATACLNLLQGDGLRRLPGLTELAILVLSGVGALWLVAITRPLLGLGLAAVAALLVAYLGMASVWWSHVWFPWLIVSAVQLPAAVVWCTLARLDQRRSAMGTRPAPAENGTPSAATQLTPVIPLATVRSPASAAHSDATAKPTVAVTSIATPIPPVAATPGSGIRDDLPVIPAPIIPDYDVLRPIGRGAYGEVWLCRSTNGIYRAVKVVRRANFEKDKPYDREFDGIRKYEPVSLSHSSLLAILHVGRRDAEGYFFYIMELGDDVQGGTVADPALYEPRNLAKDIKLKGRLPVLECLALGEGLASALEVLHGAGLLHRDIKPSNIIFLRGIPKLADIGLVALADRDEGAFSFVGTMGYIAPEGPRTAAADIYSLGKVLFEAGNGIGASDYPAVPHTSIERPDWPGIRRLNEIVFKACEMNPRQRFGSAIEFREALRSLRIQLSAPSGPGTADAAGPAKSDGTA